MQSFPAKIPDVKIIQPDRFMDPRGHFEVGYHEEEYAKAGLPTVWKQENTSRSFEYVLRGLHIQRKNPQGKLIRCLSGVIWDVWVDLRQDSPTFKEWGCLTLNGHEPMAIYLPPGFAHGFYCASKTALVNYKCTELYDAETDGGIHWKDQSIGIEWPFTPGFEPEISAKDKALPSLDEYLKSLG